MVNPGRSATGKYKEVIPLSDHIHVRDPVKLCVKGELDSVDLFVRSLIGSSSRLVDKVSQEVLEKALVSGFKSIRKASKKFFFKSDIVANNQQQKAKNTSNFECSAAEYLRKTRTERSNRTNIVSQHTQNWFKKHIE